MLSKLIGERNLPIFKLIKLNKMKKNFELKKTYTTDVEIEILINDEGQFYADVKRNIGEGLLSEEESYCITIDKDGSIQIEENTSEAEWDAIMDTFEKYIIANGVKYARKCSKCNVGMNEGFIIANGDEYYCSDNCLHQVYTKEEWNAMTDDDDDDDGFNYYTEWESNEDYEYVLFNNFLIEI